MTWYSLREFKLILTSVGDEHLKESSSDAKNTYHPTGISNAPLALPANPNPPAPGSAGSLPASVGPSLT